MMVFVSRLRAALLAHVWPLALLFLLPILVNAPALSGIFNNDPTLQFSGLGTQMRAGLIGGQMSWLDPTVGYITQPLGHLVVSDWLHGIVPWWNPYSGVGMPLAAEMEGAVFFFPFVFLLHWNCGWLLLRVLMQICCGLFAYAFFTEINLRRAAAFLGAALFSLSPLFFLSPHSAIYPLPFLPLLLLGIEYSARAARAGRAMGWSLVTVAVAYAILGGFPETAFLDGLLGGVWALWLFSRMPVRVWPRFAGKLALGLVIALGLCAPQLIPFFEYLPHANVGPHGGDIFMHKRLETTLVPLQIFPFLYGPLASSPPAALAAGFGEGWVRMPSWIGLPVLTLAIAALWRRGGQVQPRLVLLAWVVLWEARYIGFAPAVWLFYHVPGMATSDIIRFSGPMLCFAMFTLAAFGFDDYLALGAMGWRRLCGVAGSVLLVLVAALAPVAGYVAQWWQQKPLDMAVALFAAQLVLQVVVFLGLELRRPKYRYILVGLVLAGPVAALAYPQLAGFRGGKINTAPVRFLQAHIGTGRMISLGPLDLNFPLGYGIASINYAAMPTPMAWTNYITDHLFVKDDLSVMKVDLSIYTGGTDGARRFLLRHLADYEALGVRYIVTKPDDELAAAPFPLAALQGGRQPHEILPDAGGFVDAQAGYVPYASLSIAGDYTGSLSVDLSSPVVSAASVVLGTYMGAARGALRLTLCAAGQCQTGTADLAKAADNEPQMFRFAAPLTVPPGAEIRFRFSHPDGTPVVIWQAPGFFGAALPSFGFYGADGAALTGQVVSDLSLAFRDESVAIYQLAHPADYASSVGADCRLDVVNRQEMHSTCAAPGRIIRRELYFPGWSAKVNGVAAAVSAEGLFQSVAVPQGEARISFSYAPPHARLAFVLALLAVLAWVGLAARGRLGRG